MATDAQIAANLRDDRASTAPGGRGRDRADALRLGLCSSAVVVEDAEMVRERAWHVYEGLKPQNKYQAWLCDQVTVLSLRSDRARRVERRACDKAAFRACVAWDDDRALEASSLGRRLAAGP